MNALAKQAYETAVKRGQTKNVFKHLAGEVIEAQEACILYQNHDFTKTNRDEEKELLQNLSLELADVIICALSISEQMQVDIEKAVKTKMAINKDRAKNGR